MHCLRVSNSFFNEIWLNKQCKQYFPYNLYIIGMYSAIIGL